MLKFLERSPLRVLTIILFMVVTLPSQKALGAEMTFEQADAYLKKVMDGQGTFDAEEVRKAVDVISAKLIRDGDSQATVPNILSNVLDTYTRISLLDPSRRKSLGTYRNKQGKSLLHLLRDLGRIPDFLEWLPNDEKICKPLSDMLKAKDNDGRTPLDGIFPDRKMLQSLKIINPDLLKIPTGPDKITPGIRLTLSPDPLCAVPEVGSLSDPLFQSFWQQDIKKKEKEQANTLWKEYLLVKKNHDSDDFFKSAPLRIRVLDTLSRNDALHPTIKSTALGNMISTGGTFGINFQRTAKDLGFEEILAMHRGIASYVGAVYAVKNKEFRAKEYVGLKEEQILSNVLKGVALRIRDDLMPRAEKLAGFTPDQKRKLANHQMTCAVLAADHLLGIAPSEYGEDLNRQINLLLDESSSLLSIGKLKIEPDPEGRRQKFDRLFKEKRQEYEQKMETLRASQAAARQRRERDGFLQ